MDEQDFERMIACHYPRIRRAALLLSNGNDWDADDLAQETLLQAAQSWPRFCGLSEAGTWLYSILLNQHRRRLRAAKRLWRRWLVWFDRRPSDDSAGAPGHTLEAEEWRASLWIAVAKLPDPQKQALLLRYSEELSYEQIASVLRCPIGTVKSRLHQGLAALHRQLADHELTKPS